MRLVAAVLLVAVAGGTARADTTTGAKPGDDLAEAIRLEAALEYEQALAIVERIIAAGTTTDPARLAELHLYAGRLAAGLDRPHAAREHFARALALRPDLTLPDGTSPKITAPFEAARAANDALRMRTPPTPPPSPPPAPAPAPPSLAGRASTWVIAAGGALVIGGLCAWRFQVAQDDWDRLSQDGLHDYSQLRAVETRGDRWGIATDVSFGVAAATGVTAAILYVVHRPSPIVVGDHSVGVAARF